MREPYFKSNAPALPDPSRVAAVRSRRIIGWQCHADGTLRFSVWRGECELDKGEGVRYWVNTGGATRFLSEQPRVDRLVEASPGWVELG